MIDKAIEKINTEMQKNPSDAYTEIIGHYIIDRCSDEITAQKIMADGKSLDGAMKAVMSKAEKARKDNTAVLLPKDVFGAVDAYFGFVSDEQAQESAMAAASGGPRPAVAPPATKKVVLDLADFL